MANLWRELRLALRSWRTAPGVALIALLTLAVGTGAATTIFSAVDAVLLRPLPLPQSQQLVSVRSRSRQIPNYSISYPDYLDWAAEQRSFTALAAYAGVPVTLTHAGPPAVLAGQKASANYFQVLGVAPELGRTFSATDDRLGAPNVVVLADALWRSRFGADPAILGKTIELDAKPRTVVGVMPPGYPGFAPGEYAPQVFLPLAPVAAYDPSMADRAGHSGLNALGRLKPGVTEAAARADMERIAAVLARKYPKSNAGVTVAVEPFLDRVIRNSGPQTLWMLLAAVGLVLLIACVNVANLLFARATGRQKANAVRAALGASRARLLREHLAEALWLGGGGAALGLGLARLAMRAAPALIPRYMARADQLYLDGRVLAFSLALALATTVICGLLPAWQASRAPISAVLQQGGRDSAGGGGGWRHGLVVLEMALAVVLLVGAGLLIRSMLRLQNVDPGFNPRGVLTFDVQLPPRRYAQPAQTQRFFRRASASLAALPGVVATGVVTPLPFSGQDAETYFTIVGRPAPPAGQEPLADFAVVGGDYFRALGMRQLRGRGFTQADTPASPQVAVVDDSFARKYWPPDAALGGQIRLLGGPVVTVVGVVARVQDYSLAGGDPQPQLFRPLGQLDRAANAMDFALRVHGGAPTRVLGAAAAAIHRLDPDLPLDDVFTMDQRIGQSLQQSRLTLWLMGAFAALALLLASAGVHGVLAYAVARRAHEFGVRMALGADAGRLRALVLGQGLRLAALGAAAGLAAALALGQYAQSFLFGVAGRDPVTFAAVPLLLLAVAALACYLPARRATRVDPMVALRGD